MEKAGRHNGCICTNIGQMNRSLHTMLQVWITTSPLLATVCPLGLEKGLDDKLVAEDAVASLDAGEEFMSTRFA